jgi:AcrR family transcriptional regulator
MGRHREFDLDEVLDAALSVFWQKGYEGTSFEDLCSATGVARPGLYAAFGNKEAFFLRALDRYDAKYMAFMSEALDEPTSFKVVECILRGSAEIQTLFSDSPGCLGVNGALACSDNGEPIRQELVRRRASTQLALRQRLERARKEGDLPESVDCTSLAFFVMTVTQGMAVQAKAGAAKKSLEGLVSQVLSTWPGKSLPRS